MPDPTQLSPIALAEQAQQITPDDAKFLNDSAAQNGVDMDLVGKDLSLARKQWDAVKNGSSFAEIARDPIAAEWLLRAHNAASVQDDLGSVVAFRKALQDTDLPDPAGVFDLAGAYANASWKKAGLGLAAVATAPWTISTALMGEETPLLRIADVAGAVDESYQTRHAAIVDRLYATGGSQFHVLLGDIAGQAPEMLASGGLSALGAKAVAAPIVKALGKLAASEAKVALTGMALIQGVQGGVMNLSARARDNADAGKDPITATDYAASLAVGAMTALTTRLAGLTGEARLLGGSKANTWGLVATDVLTQVGEETSQEVMEVLINDIADNKFSGWDAYKWSALGGAIGGGLFSAPAIFQKLTSHLPPGEREAETKRLQTLASVAQAPVAVANAEGIVRQQAILAQSKAIQRGLTLDDLAQLTGTKRTEKQFFDAADFAKVAEAFAVSPEQLAVAWGGKSEGGTVEVGTVAMTYGMRQAKPDQIAAAVEHAHKQPDKPSLTDIMARMKEIQEIAAKDEELALPGGVKDDSDEIAKDVEQEVAKAQTETKRTTANARADAQLESARWRSAAIAWNDAYTSRGESKRVTPKQLYAQNKAKVTAGTDGTMAQDDKGTYTPEIRMAKLAKAADASTVQHELSHHWLEVMRGWASDPAAPAIFKEQLQTIGSWATDKAESIAKHYTATTDKGVSADAIRAAAADMANLNLNTAAGKAIHEGFTGAYEQYLATGKAPTTALKRVFASFRKWMSNIMRSMYGSELLSDDVKAVFDRMLTSRDQIEQPHLNVLTAESLGVSDEMFYQVELARDQAIRSAQVELEKILERRAKEYAKRDEATFRAEVQKLVDSKPENRARAILAKERLHKESAHAVVTDPAKQAALAKFVADTGLEPQVVAGDAGYSTEAGSIEMLNVLSDGKTYDDVLNDAVKQAQTMLPPLSLEDRINELRVSAEGRALAAAVEAAAIRDSVRMAQIGKKEGIAEGKAAAKATADAAAEQQAQVSEEQVNAMKASRDAWRTKAKDAATRMRAQKAVWDVEGARIIAEMEQENAALSNDGAAYRLMQKTHSQSALQQEQDGLVKKMAKAVKNRDYQAAINAHLEILTISKMRSMLAAKSVQDVKSDAAARKSDTIDALAAQAAYDAALMAELAQDKIAHMPAVDLREGVWAKRAMAARRRREKAVADQNVPAILKATTEIMWAETMEAEVLRTLDEKAAMASAINKGLALTERVKLAYAGTPTIYYEDGRTETFPTWDSAMMRHSNIRGYASGAVLSRGKDLVNIRDAIEQVMAGKSRSDGIALLNAVVDGKQDGITYMTPRMKGLVDEHRNAPQQPAGGGKLNPDEWTLHDWVTIQEQMETIQKAADMVPRQREDAEAAIKDMLGAVDMKAKPPTQREAMIGALKMAANWAAGTLNIRTLGAKLGDSFERHIMRPLLASQSEGEVLDHRIRTKLQGKIDAFTGSDRKRMAQRYTIQGVETDRWERISRLMMMGTTTGRDRVVADLRLRNCTNTDAFLADMVKDVTAKEADLVQAWWAANAEIYKFLQASETRSGMPNSKPLQAIPFDILVDGKPVRLEGGYAAVPYLLKMDTAHIMDDKGKMVLAYFDKGYMNERVKHVDAKLDLTVEAQFNSQSSKIRTAALMPHAHSVSSIITDHRFKSATIEHYGEDWYNDMVKHVRFAFNGDSDAKSALNSVAGYFRYGFTFSVYWGNLKTAVSQFTGIINAAAHPDVGPLGVARAMRDILKEGRGFSQRIARSSYITLMRTHAQDPDYMSPEKVTSHAKVYEKWLAAGTYPMRMAQWGVDTITWDGAYQTFKARNSGKITDPTEIEYKAIAAADRALNETQGSAMRAEQAAISQNEFGRMLTFGGKWMLNYGNYLRRQYTAAMGEFGQDTWQARRAFANSVVVGLVMNAIMYQALRAIVSPEKDDDEKRELKDYAWATGLDVVGTPFHAFRMFGKPIFESFMAETKPNGQGGGFEIAGERTLQDAKMLATNVGYIMRGEDKKGLTPAKLIGQAVNTGSIILPGLPGTMTKRIMDSDEDEAFDWFVAAVFGYDKTPMIKD